MTDHLKLLLETKQKLLKALSRLEHSFNKIKTISSKTSELADDELALWESFTARFSRASDLFLSKYLRIKVLSEDPSFKGTFRDLLNISLKHGWIDSIEKWMAIRELRNLCAHEYSEEKLPSILESVRKETICLLNLKTTLL